MPLARAGAHEGRHGSKNRIDGEVIIKSADLSRMLTVIVFIAIAAPLLFAALVQYSRKETVDGRLMPDQGMIDVVAREGGVLENIAVKDGAWVEAGQPIATLRLAADAQTRYVITTPMAGRIAALPLQTSQVVSPEATVAIVLPGASKLLAELYVPSRAAGFIRPGQRVRLMYDSYPFEKYGVGEGKIREVSAAAMAPNEHAWPGYKGEVPMFRVRVELARAFVTADGKEFPLKPGSTLRADIIIERRTLLEWLFQPLLRAKMRS